MLNSWTYGVIFVCVFGMLRSPTQVSSQLAPPNCLPIQSEGFTNGFRYKGWHNDEAMMGLDFVIGTGQSTATGPAVDNTLGTDAGKYLVFDTTERTSNSIGFFTSPQFSVPSTPNCSVEFYVYAATAGSFTVRRMHVSGASPKALQSVDVQSVPNWERVEAQVDATEPFKIIISIFVGQANGPFIAVDDLSFNMSTCGCLTPDCGSQNLDFESPPADYNGWVSDNTDPSFDMWFHETGPGGVTDILSQPPLVAFDGPFLYMPSSSNTSVLQSPALHLPDAPTNCTFEFYYCIRRSSTNTRPSLTASVKPLRQQSTTFLSPGVVGVWTPAVALVSNILGDPTLTFNIQITSLSMSAGIVAIDSLVFNEETCGCVDLKVCGVAPDPLCKNGGTCVDQPGNNFTCTCSSGFTGAICEEDVNECLQVPVVCLNGASCANTNGSYNCTCAVGYIGDDCQTDVNECLQVPAVCLNGALCVNTNGSYHCTCAVGYTGDACQTGVPFVIVTDEADGVVFKTSYREGQSPLIPTIEVHRASVQNFATDPICRIIVRLMSINSAALDHTDQLVLTNVVANIQQSMISSTEVELANHTLADLIPESAWIESLAGIRFYNTIDEPSLAQRQVTITPVLCSGLEGHTSLTEILITRVNDKSPTLVANLYKDL